VKQYKNAVVMKNLEIIWIATAIVLTNATQLRLSSLPVGPGEVMLFVWILFVIIRLGILKYHLLTPIFQVNFCFWIVAFTSLILGFVIAELMDVTSPSFPHDLFSFIFALLFSTSCSISEVFSKKPQRIISYVISGTILLLFIIFCFPSLLPFFAPWYGGIRFTGWSKNPNQLALLLSMIPFTALHLLNTSRSFVTKTWYFWLIVFCFVIGSATQSDALIISWAVGFGIIVFLVIFGALQNVLVSQNFTYLLKRVYQQIIGLILILISIISIKFVYQNIYLASADVYDKGGQGSDRVTLWANGIAALAHSPLFGLGPGSHSGENGPFLDFEAHNTFIDWGASSGIVGLTAYITLLAWVAWSAWRKGFVVLFAAVISLAAFSSFHYVLRHPIFWFYLLAIATLSTQSSKTTYASAHLTKKRQKTYIKDEYSTICVE